MPNKRNPNRTTVGFSVSKKTLAELKKIAKERGANVSNILERIAEQIIKEENERNNKSNKGR